MDGKSMLVLIESPNSVALTIRAPADRPVDGKSMLVLVELTVHRLALTVHNLALTVHTVALTIRNIAFTTHRNITSFYGSSCANNVKDALNTPETIRYIKRARARDPTTHRMIRPLASAAPFFASLPLRSEGWRYHSLPKVFAKFPNARVMALSPDFVMAAEEVWRRVSNEVAQAGEVCKKACFVRRSSRSAYTVRGVALTVRGVALTVRGVALTVRGVALSVR
eukprot:1191930-Prorocentrum_minimum.AAC.2